MDQVPGREAVGALVQVDHLVFERTPQQLDKNGVHAPAPPLHRDADAGRLQTPGEGEAGDLAALVGVEDLRRAVAIQGLLKRLDTEACVQRVRQPPGQDVPACPVHDRHQIQEAALHRDIGDVGAPDVVRPLDPQVLEQTGPHPVLGMRHASPRRPVDRLKTQQAHQTTDPAAVFQ